MTIKSDFENPPMLKRLKYLLKYFLRIVLSNKKMVSSISFIFTLVSFSLIIFIILGLSLICVQFIESYFSSVENYNTLLLFVITISATLTNLAFNATKVEENSKDDTAEKFKSAGHKLFIATFMFIYTVFVKYVIYKIINIDYSFVGKTANIPQFNIEHILQTIFLTSGALAFVYGAYNLIFAFILLTYKLRKLNKNFNKAMYESMTKENKIV